MMLMHVLPCLFMTMLHNSKLTDAQNLCIGNFTAICPEKSTCFDGCDCQSTELSCPSGLPICFNSVIMSSSFCGESVQLIDTKALSGSCHKGVSTAIIANFQVLEKIKPGIFDPLSHALTDIYIRNNSLLSYLSIHLFRGYFPYLRLLAVEDHPVLSNMTFLTYAQLPHLTELLLVHNNISVIPCDLFAPFPLLQRVDLRLNHIITVDECTMGVALYNNPTLEFFLPGNPIECNCSILPLINGQKAAFDMLQDHIRCANDVMNMSGLTLQESSYLLYEECGANKSYELVRNSSRCSCDYINTHERCLPDCVLWSSSKRRPCVNSSEGFEHIEGCVCDYIILYLEVKLGKSWHALYCSEKGALTAHLSTMSWKLWLPGAAVITLIGILPGIYQLCLWYKNQKTKEEDDDIISVDEEVVEYLLWGIIRKKSAALLQKPKQKFQHAVKKIRNVNAMLPPKEKKYADMTGSTAASQALIATPYREIKEDAVPSDFVIPTSDNNHEHEHGKPMADKPNQEKQSDGLASSSPASQPVVNKREAQQRGMTKNTTQQDESQEAKNSKHDANDVHMPNKEKVSAGKPAESIAPPAQQPMETATQPATNGGEVQESARCTSPTLPVDPESHRALNETKHEEIELEMDVPDFNESRKHEEQPSLLSTRPSAFHSMTSTTEPMQFEPTNPHHQKAASYVERTTPDKDSAHYHRHSELSTPVADPLPPTTAPNIGGKAKQVRRVESMEAVPQAKKSASFESLNEEEYYE